jgi:hypothetical protein
MVITVSEEILNQTADCDKNFSCLSFQDELCEVLDKIGKGFLFVDCREAECSYCQPVGYAGGACSCPTRMELYERYGI